MSDPIDEIFNGTPDGIDEDELKQMQQQEQINAAAADNTAEQMQEESSPTTTASQPKQQPQPTAKAEEPKESSGIDAYTDAFKDSLVNSYAAPALGLADFAVDTVNLIPGVDIPKASKFDNDVSQSIREITSVVVPTVALTASGVGALGTAGKASKLKVLADPFVKWLGTTAASAGIGATVDGISSTSEGDNLSGSLKQNFPRTFAWIPDNIATFDGESPDDKRIKNITEGVGLGLFADVAGSFATLLRNAQGVKSSTKWIPESEKAKNWLGKNAPEVTDNVETVVEKSAAKRSDDLDSLGTYNLSKSQNLDEPIFGVHDMYGYQESGIRSADDMGIVGASVDLVRVQKNLDSVYGRLGSVMSEPAMKYSLDGVEEYTAVLKGLRETLSDAGEYGYRLDSGKVINSKTIREAGENLAKDFGYMSNKELDAAIDKLKTGIDADTQLPALSSEGMAAVKIAIKDAMKEYSAVGDGVAHALVRTSLGGQVSDMAQGLRYAEGTAAVTRTQEQILDRLEMLMIANGEVGKQRGLSLNLMNVFKRNGKLPSAAELRKKGADTLKQLKAEAKQVRDTFEELKENNPEMFKAMMDAYEYSDGDIKTIDALNNYVRNSLGVFNKAFVDLDPSTPSLLMRAFHSNVYNSILSALGTPIKAASSAAAMMIEKPAAMFAGAISTGEYKLLKRGFYQYQAAGDTFNKARKYFAESMRRSAIDPNYTGGAGRESIIQKNEKQIKILKSFADAKAAKGDFGPQYMMEQVEQMQQMADHPWLRIGNRLMQATDGFTQSVIGNLEARGRAWDMVDTGKIDADIMDDIAQKQYEQIWKKDPQGRPIISDEAVRYASGEIALNLDSKLNDAISAFVRHVPAAKPFLLFTRTPIAGMKFVQSHSPVSLLVKQMNQFALPFDEMPMAKVEELLSGRGISIENPAQARSAYTEIRAEMQGRKAIGTMAVGGAVTLMMNDRITGDGLYDKEKQRVRRDAGWKKRSVKGLDGKYYSYEFLGPAISDWIAFTVNIMDNMDVLGDGNVQQYLHAAGFVLAASITDKSMLAGIEPIYDILNGNGAAINRWASSFIPSAVTPGASLMAEFGRLISPNLRVVEEDLFSMIANRTALKGTLPDQTDYLYGDKINEYEPTVGGFMRRLVNTYTPFKVYDNTRPEAQFLMDVEFDMRPSMKTDSRGVDLEIDEQARVYEVMGEQGIYLREIKKIMQTSDAKEFRRKFKEYSSKGGTPNLQDFENIHYRLRNALNKAKAAAIDEINKTGGYAITKRGQQNNEKRRQDSYGNLFIPTR